MPTRSKVEPTVFLSYSRKDLAFVDRLDGSLGARGVTTLVDRSAIEIGERWFERIQDLIAQAETIVFVLSPDSIQSPICAEEISFGKRLGKRFIPVLARAVDDPGVPAVLSELNYVFLDDERTYEAQVDRLVAAIRTDLAWMRVHADLGRSAVEWSRSGRPRGLLLSSARLKSTEDWLARRPANAPPPTDETFDLIAMSRQSATRWRRSLIGALTAGLVTALGLAAIAYVQRQDAVAQRLEARAQRDVAVRSLAGAKSAADVLIFDIAQGLRDRGLPVVVVRGVLERAETLMTRLVESQPDDIDVLRSRAAMYVVFADTYASAGDVERQLAAATQGVTVARRVVDLRPSQTALARDLSVALERLGNAEQARGDLPAALGSQLESLAIVRRLGQADPANQNATRDVLFSLGKVGDLQLALGNLAAALATSEEAVVIARRQFADAPSSPDAIGDLARALIRLADVQFARGDQPNALNNYEQSLTSLRRLAEEDPTDTGRAQELAVNLERTGSIRASTGDLAAALANFEECLAIRRRLAGADPGNAGTALELAIVLVKIADIHRSRDARPTALEGYRESLSIRRRLSAANPSNLAAARGLALSLQRVGSIEFALGDLAGALRAYEEGLAISRHVAASAPSDRDAARDLSIGLGNVGDVQLARGDLGGAFAVYRESLDLRRRLAEAEPENAARSQAVDTLAERIGQLALKAIVARDFDLALQASDLESEVRPEWLQPQLRRAHALMFLDRTDEARRLYAAYRGRVTETGQSWAKAIAQDYAEFRRAGLDHPTMGEIGASFERE